MQDLAREYCQEGGFWGNMGGKLLKGTKMKQMKHWILGGFLAVMLAGGALAGDFDKGLEAYESGDYATALAEFTPLAEAGLAEAQNNLGLMYGNGEGVVRDDAEAVRWLRLAAKAGLTEAQNNLGYMYRDGRGVSRDDVEAVRWFRLAAEAEYILSQFNLGVMYLAGRGVPQDIRPAYMWFSLAAAQGLEEASGGRDKLANIMTPEQLAEALDMTIQCIKQNFKDC